MGTAIVKSTDLAEARRWLKRTGIPDPKAGVRMLNALIRMGTGSGTVEICMGTTALKLDTELIQYFRHLRKTLRTMIREMRP